MLERIRKATERKDQGFTLIELLVVIIIIGILAAIAIPTFLNQRDKGYRSAMQSDLKSFQLAEEAYFTDNNGYLPAETKDAALTGLANWGAVLSDGVTFTKITAPANGTTVCIQVTHEKLSEAWAVDNSTHTTPVAGTCADAGTVSPTAS